MFFLSNIPIRIWAIFTGLLLFTAVLCIIVSYNIGLSNAVVTVSGDNYKPREAETLITDNMSMTEKLQKDLYDLLAKYQGLDANYSALGGLKTIAAPSDNNIFCSSAATRSADNRPAKCAQAATASLVSWSM